MMARRTAYVLEDNPAEGLCHQGLLVLSIQYQSEGSSGPQDNVYLFDGFLEMVTR